MPPDIKCVSPTFSAFCSGPAVPMTAASYAETVPAHRHCTAALVAGLLSSATGGSREGEHSQHYDKAGFCPAPISPSSTRASGASGCDQPPGSSVPGQGRGAQGGRAACSPRVCSRRSCPGGVCGGCWQLGLSRAALFPAPRAGHTQPWLSWLPHQLPAFFSGCLLHGNGPAVARKGARADVQDSGTGPGARMRLCCCRAHPY